MNLYVTLRILSVLNIKIVEFNGEPILSNCISK